VQKGGDEMSEAGELEPELERFIENVLVPILVQRLLAETDSQPGERDLPSATSIERLAFQDVM
jgi:hypothetical protein